MPHTAPITLASCADEPIHIPGSIQPHGALVALKDGVVVAWSENFVHVTGIQPALGTAWHTFPLPPAVHAEIDVLIAEATHTAGLPASSEAALQGRVHDVVVHLHADHVLVEFEPRAAGTSPQLSHSRVFDRIRRAPTLTALLQATVEAIRAWTGFDRVMGYRFRHDDSGDVAAEARTDALSSYLGLRYPASDIPAQARRLYLLNTLRLIPHVSYRAVPLVGDPSAPTLDLTHAVLRSVSPIHVEYLHNMGVGASMSVSLVVGGRLWGLIACHHMASLQVPYGVRADCDVLAQIVASAIATLEARELADAQAAASSLVTELVADVALSDDPTIPLMAHAPRLLAMLSADAFVATHHSDVQVAGDLPPELAVPVATAGWAPSGEPTARSCRGDWPADVRERLGPWVGALCIDLDPATGSRLIALRKEEVQTVRWAGQPDKVVAMGPNGPRLTPRGSFAEWQEVVRDCCEPWSELTRRFAGQLMLELQRTALSRHAEVEAARRNLLAMLGHDLRNPLQAIKTIAEVLQRDRGGDQALGARLGARLDSSSGRMQRLIAQVLDFSRAEAGMPLRGEHADVDLHALLDDLAEEARVAHPGFELVVRTRGPVPVSGDPVRLSQAMMNLIGNARQYGATGQPVEVALAATPAGTAFTVRNVGEPIPEAVAGALFEPFKRGVSDPRFNRTGLGLGLYIVERIVAEHGGRLQHRHEAPWVVFEFILPAL